MCENTNCLVCKIPIHSLLIGNLVIDFKRLVNPIWSFAQIETWIIPQKIKLNLPLALLIYSLNLQLNHYIILTKS
jgi:hypothetical protein